jgi:hypothetical protein
MGDTCLPGLQGFPVQVAGWTAFTEKVSIVIPNDIQLQFSPSETPMAYDPKTGALNFSGSNTFFMGGTQYTLRSVRLAQPKQTGLANFSGTPVAELQFWGASTAARGAPTNLAVLCLPLYQKPVESSVAYAVVNAVTGQPARLLDMIPEGDRVDVIKYTTCIETNIGGTAQISVAYWASGIPMEQELLGKLPKTFAPAGIPDIFGYKFLSAFEQYADERRTKGRRQYNDVSNILQTYTALAMSVSTPEFRNGFRLIQNFKKLGVVSRDTSAYKCIAIDRSKDIKQGKLLVDPKTGRKLSEEVELAETLQAESMDEPTASPRDIWLRVCIIIGTLLGISFIALGIVALGKFMFDRKTQGIPPLDKATAALQKTLPKTITGVH